MCWDLSVEYFLFCYTGLRHEGVNVPSILPGCPPGSRCGPRPGTCFHPHTSTSIRRVISKSTSTFTSTSTSSSTISTPTSHASKVSEFPEIPEAPEAPEASKIAECEPSLTKRLNRQQNCEYECHNGKLIPVASFESIQGQTDQLIISMCSGTRPFSDFAPSG